MKRSYRSMEISRSALAALLRELQGLGLIKIDLPKDFDFRECWHDEDRKAIGVMVWSCKYKELEPSCAPLPFNSDDGFDLDNALTSIEHTASSVEPGRKVVAQRDALLAAAKAVLEVLRRGGYDNMSTYQALDKAVKEVDDA